MRKFDDEYVRTVNCKCCQNHNKLDAKCSKCIRVGGNENLFYPYPITLYKYIRSMNEHELADFLFEWQDMTYSRELIEQMVSTKYKS